MQEEQMRRVASYFSVLYSHTDVSWGWKTFTGEELHSLINASELTAVTQRHTESGHKQVKQIA